MYLDFFNLENKPFDLTPNTDLYCILPTHREALEVLLEGLKNQEGFIKITGEVGSGKTLLCRLLLKHLPDNFVSMYLPNPKLTIKGLHLHIASELGIKKDPNRSEDLVELISQELINIKKQHKHAVLIIDEAQSISENGLEAIRLLTNLETEEEKLLQIVLFGQPELNGKLNAYNMRQLKQRIIFSYHLSLLNKKEVEIYINHRLAKSGHTYGALFTKSSHKLIYKATQGIPRLINIICHKALMSAYSNGKRKVCKRDIKRAILDTESTNHYQNSTIPILIALSVSAISLFGAFYMNNLIPL